MTPHCLSVAVHRAVRAATHVHRAMSAHDILGSPDELKFRSSMTLFALVSPPGSLFHRAIDRFYEGEMDPRTLDMLGR